MKREDLKALELADDVIDTIMALHGKDVEATKTAVETAKAELSGLKKQLEDANAQIKSFEGMDIDGVKKAAADWEAKAKQAETDAQATIDALRFDHALESALTGAKAKSVKAVRALLSTDDLKLSESGEIIGLDKQLEALKSDNDFLFEADEAPPATPKIVAGGQPATTTSDPFWEAMLRGSGLKAPTE
jgi:predicted  nucleic acid-binding Zn-ribbon protein